MRINVTNKEELLVNHEKFTKQNKPFRPYRRVNWDLLTVSGNVFTTHFGDFKFLSKSDERDNKNKLLHFWIMKDIVTGIVYKIKREQATKNKKLPKTAIIIEVDTEENNKTNANKNIMDDGELEIFYEILKDNEDYPINSKKEIFEFWNEERANDYEDFIITLFDVISWKNDFRQIKSVFRKLMRHYHPDMGGTGDAKKMAIIKETYDFWKSEMR